MGDGRGVMGSCVRSVFAESQVTTIFMVVADVRPHERHQMALAENHNVLEELEPTAADPAFGGPVLPRAAVEGANRLCAHRLDEPDQAEPKIESRSKRPRIAVRCRMETPHVVAESPTKTSGGTWRQSARYGDGRAR